MFFFFKKRALYLCEREKNHTFPKIRYSFYCGRANIILFRNISSHRSHQTKLVVTQGPVRCLQKIWRRSQLETQVMGGTKARNKFGQSTEVE